MRLGLLQFAPRLGVVEPNLNRVLKGVRRAAAAGTDLLIAPEMCLTGWMLPDSELRGKLADEVERVAVPELAGAARREGIGVVVGGPLRRGADVSNCAIGFGPRGDVTVHRKMHLFGEEARWWTKGNEVVTLEVHGTRVGLLICYDGEFPEVPRLVRLAGAQVMAVPTTNMTPYEHDQDLIFATRALENECVVAVCNRIGEEGALTYFGRSLVADARGRVVAQAGSEEELLLVDVDVSRPHADPELSYLSRRRPEIYGALAEHVVNAG